MSRFSSYSVLAVVLAAALPFGSVLPWAYTGFGFAVGVLLLAWGYAVATGRLGVAAPPAELWLAGLIAFAVLAWALAQGRPALLAGLHHEIWRQTHAALGSAYVGAVSVDPATSELHALRFLAYAGVLWLGFQAATERRRAEHLLYGFTVGCGAYALYGLIVQFSGSNTVLWFDKTSYFNVVTGPFVNRNSFATYLGLGLICATALLWQQLRESVTGIEGATERRRALLEFLASKSWLLLSCWLVIAVALILTRSRAGNFATALALAVFFAALAIRGRASARPALLCLGAATVAGVFVFALSGSGLEERLHRVDDDWAMRARIYASTLDAIDAHQYQGAGLGTFEQVFRMYRSPEIVDIFARAHSDYLELALDLGLPAAAAWMLVILLLGGACLAGARRRRRAVALPAAGLAACVLMGLHSIVDFSLQIPAVAASFALILGVAVAQSRRPARRVTSTAAVP